MNPPRTTRASPALVCALVTLAGAWFAGCGGSSTGGGASAPSPLAVEASAFVSSRTYTSLVVEVDYVQGHAPDSSALALLEQRLVERLAKPQGIAIRLDDAIAPLTSRYSVADLESLEAQHRDLRSQGTQAALYLIYVDGGCALDDSSGAVLGLAYGASSLAIFPESMAAAANSVVSASEIEGAVLVHEAGHALGLVNNGTAMVSPHEDGAHAKHDRDDRCVMYYAVESTNLRNLIFNRGSVPTEFCAECIADLQAAGGL